MKQQVCAMICRSVDTLRFIYVENFKQKIILNDALREKKKERGKNSSNDELDKIIRKHKRFGAHFKFKLKSSSPHHKSRPAKFHYNIFFFIILKFHLETPREQNANKKKTLSLHLERVSEQTFEAFLIELPT